MDKPAGSFQNLLMSCLCHSRKVDKKGEDIKNIALQNHKQFSFQALASATGNFRSANLLGSGGFGPVYRGKLDDGREIAVKKLSHCSGQGNREFTNEARLLTRIQHRNIVNLLGYCSYGSERLLVYEFVANKSLDKLLFSHERREHLDWNQRYITIMGVARGLLHLHEDSHNRIIHRDIKASNVLLDDKWVPKIADFGMARLFPEDKTHVNTRIAGTNGYMAPEYVMFGQLSDKADVFSFGVLVLELVTGQRSSTFDHPTARNLPDWVYLLFNKNQISDIIDPLLKSSEEEQIRLCIHVSLLCTQSNPDLRPKMHRVFILLSKKPGSLEKPTRPGTLGSEYRRYSAASSTLGTSDQYDPHASDSSSCTATITSPRAIGPAS